MKQIICDLCETMTEEKPVHIDGHLSTLELNDDCTFEGIVSFNVAGVTDVEISFGIRSQEDLDAHITCILQQCLIIEENRNAQTETDGSSEEEGVDLTDLLGGESESTNPGQVLGETDTRSVVGTSGETPE